MFFDFDVKKKKVFWSDVRNLPAHTHTSYIHFCCGHSGWQSIQIASGPGTEEAGGWRDPRREGIYWAYGEYRCIVSTFTFKVLPWHVIQPCSPLAKIAFCMHVIQNILIGRWRRRGNNWRRTASRRWWRRMTPSWYWHPSASFYGVICWELLMNLEMN